jgi:endoglycosylceramidase
MTLRWLAALVLGLAAIGCGGGGGEQLDAGVPYLHDVEGRVVVYHGVNYTGEAKAPPDFTVALADDDLDRMAGWGVTLVRFLVFWEAIEPTQGAYDEAYLDRVEAQIRSFTARGIDVFVDLHQDLFGRGFNSSGLPRFACTEDFYATYVPKDPWYLNYMSAEVSGCFDYFFTHAELQDAYAAAAAHLAARVADDPHVIAYDPMNEPYFGSASVSEFEPNRLWPFYQRVETAVRAVAPNALVFLEPSAARNLGFATALPAFGAAEVYAPHYYPQSTETGAYDGDPSWVQADIQGLADDAVRLGAPFVLGETGIISDHDRAGDFIRDLMDALDSHFASVAFWDYGRGGGWSLLDADGNEQVTAQAFVRPYLHRIAGAPLAMSYDAATGVFQASWAEAGITAPTEIVVPPRLVAQAVTLGDSRDSYAHDTATGRLTVTGHPKVATHTITITLQAGGR